MSWNYTNPVQPSPDESCDASKNYEDGFFTPPVDLVEPGNLGRLIWPLRAAAATTDPATMLALSAACYAMANLPGTNMPGPVPPEPQFPPTAQLSTILSGGLAIVGADRGGLAHAFADLCASGRNAYSSFTGSPPSQAAVAAAASSLLAGVTIGGTAIETAVQSAFSRANAVAACLGAIQPSKAVRRGLGWIALSAEDDPPRRPVNISTLQYPQYDLTVSVPTQSGPMTNVEARYVVISDQPTAGAEPVFAPDAHILLFIHGDGSRSEEGDPLVAPLLAAGASRGHPYTIIAVDLPSHGCSTMVDPLGPVFDGTPPWNNSSPLPVSRPPNYPVLEFLENFILAFVAAMSAQYNIGEQFVGPMGGSLGGNMTLRLARSNAPWTRCAIAWSPASIWNSLADDLIKQAGPNHCSTEGHASEDDDARANFFNDVFFASTNLAWFQLVAPQGTYWYRDDWQPCKTNILAAAQLERAELYNRIYRQFHYRMDWEQLVYSFNDEDPGSPQPRYASFLSTLLLAAGAADNKSPATDIYDSARTLGKNLESTKTNGSTLFAEDTGHSMHDERPILMANQIDAFIGGLDYTSMRQYLLANGVPLPARASQILKGRRSLRFVIQI
jgi:pimeloyl-ACP methyl ester carboxylesterase